MTNTTQRNATTTNADALAAVGRKFIMKEAHRIFRQIGTPLVPRTVYDFATALKEAWALARRITESRARPRAIAVRTVPAPRGLSPLARNTPTHSRWGRDSYRYNTTVLAR